MAKQNQTADPQASKKSKTGKPISENLSGEGILAQELPNPIAVLDQPAIQDQADRLSDSRLSTVQRQIMARQISQGQGNQHLQRVIAATRSNGQANGSQTTPAKSTTKSKIQPKLYVNEPDDQYEQEADQIAEAVMRMPALATPPPDDEEPADLTPRSSLQPAIQMQSEGVPEVSPETEANIEALSGGGETLPPEEQAFFEARIGADFSNVRIHTDNTAVQTAQDLNARAYTVGSDIAFNSGEYQPGTDSGRQLLAHELTHVIQQGEAQPAVQRQEAAESAGDDLPTEEEKAEALAKAEAAKGEAGAAKDKAKAQKEQASGEAEGKKAEGEGPKVEAEASKAAGPVNKTPNADRQAAVAEQATAQVASGEAQQAAAADATQAAISEAVDGGAASNAESRAEVMTEPTEIAVGAGSGGSGASPEGATDAATAKTEEVFGGAEDAPDKAPSTPNEDPAYLAVVTAGKAIANEKQTHEPASTKADAAQAAAESPASELTGQAQAVQVGEMEQAETPGFDAAAFKAKLMAQIEALAPKTPGDADQFKEGGEMGAVKGEMQGQVSQEKEASQGSLEAKSSEAPDPNNAEPKPVTPLTEPDPGQAPATIGAEQAAPKPKGKGEIEEPLQAGSQSIDDQMADANVTDEQLEKSNEPEFQGALASKDEAQTSAAQAPAEYRADEQDTINTAQTDAAADAQQQTEAMQGDRTELLAQVATDQVETKSEDEQKRAEIANHINGIYERTKSKVETILSELDNEVSQAFDTGAEAARQTFEDYVDRETEAYKQERYGGLLGWARWIEDQFSTNEELNAIVDRGVQQYLSEMDAVIDKVVAIIGTRLAEAKAAVAEGKQEVQDYVNQLPEDLQSIGQEAAQDVQSRFDELEQSIDDKQGELIDSLANKYQESLEQVNARAEEMREANKGLIDRAIDAIGGVIKAILKMKDMLMNVLAKAASVIQTIIDDPIGFLGNLIDAVVMGFELFVDNIGTHLKKGLISWLTGSLADAGITIPETFDLPGILQLVMDILGLSFNYVMGKLSDVLGIDIMGIIDPIKQLIGIYQEEGFEGLIKFGLAKLIGEENMGHLMKVWEIIQMVMSGNFGQLWEVLQEYLDSLKETIMGEIIELITEKVIVAGAKWVISLFNPASAFIKACMMIYDVVMFFINNGSRIIQLVTAVLDSIGNIAAGNISGAAKFIEGALAQGIPVAISFLSSLLGIGDLSSRVQKIIQSVRGMVDGAIDGLLNSGPVQAVVGFIKNIVGKVVALAQAGFEKAKGAVGLGSKKKKKGDDDIDDAEGEEKHKAIGLQIKKTLDSEPDENETPDALYQRKLGEAEALKTKYQPQLEPGINLDIDLTPPASKEDGDIKVAVTIAPNDYHITFGLDTDDDEARFSKLLYDALKRIGDKHYEGEHKADFASDTNISTADFSDDARAREQVALSTQQQQHEEQMKAKSESIHQKVSIAQGQYARASQAKMVPNNTFQVGGGSFFVETHDNYYIVPQADGEAQFQYKPTGISKTIPQLIQQEADARMQSAQVDTARKRLLGLQHAANNNFISKKKAVPEPLQARIDAAQAELDALTSGGEDADAERLANLASDNSVDGKLQQLEFVKGSLNNPDEYKFIRNVAGQEIKIYLPNDVIRQFDYAGNPVDVEQAKTLYEGFPGSINASQELTVFLASLLAEPARSSVSHITNMLLLDDKKSTLSSGSPKQTRMDEAGNDITNSDSTSIFEHTSMTQPGSDPTGNRTKEFPHDARLGQAEVPEGGDNSRSTTTNSNVSNRDLASIQHNPVLNDALLNYFKANQEQDDESIINSFMTQIEQHLELPT